MSLYNFSSVDPEHYNRIRTTIPNNFLTRYVNICVSTFTSNCNIEVLNKNDYIEIDISGVKHKVFCDDQYSRISTAVLPSMFNEWFKNADLDISIEITTVDTIVFKSKELFKITDMSYNMKLITGFYCLDEKKWPIASELKDWNEERTDPEPVPLTYAHINDIDILVDDTRPVNKMFEPKDAYGYTISYITADQSIADMDENGYIKGIGPGEVEISYEIRNPGIPDYLPASYKGKFKATVGTSVAKEVSALSDIEDQTIIVGYTTDLFPTVEPWDADYYLEWSSSDKYVARAENGLIIGLKPGTAVIDYTVNWKSGNETRSIKKHFTLTVEPEKKPVKRHLIIGDSVGYMLSTPILYLLTNIGSHVFYNNIKNDKDIQCGMVCMCLNNSFSSSFPIVAQQGEIITKCALNNASDVFFILVDANMREVKLLNPMYITVSIRPDEDALITPGLL